MEYQNLVDPLKGFLENVNDNKKCYKNIEVSLVIVKQENENVLYEGTAIFRHKSDDNLPEITYDYGEVILARRILEIDEFLLLFEKETNGIIKIKDLDEIYIGKSFNKSVYHIPSNTSYGGIISDWPVKAYYFGSDHDKQLDSPRGYLVKPNYPTYSSFFDASNSFLKTKHEYQDSRIRGIQILVPDFKAKMKTIEISEKKYRN